MNNPMAYTDPSGYVYEHRDMHPLNWNDGQGMTFMPGPSLLDNYTTSGTYIGFGSNGSSCGFGNLSNISNTGRNVTFRGTTVNGYYKPIYTQRTELFGQETLWFQGDKQTESTWEYSTETSIIKSYQFVPFGGDGDPWKKLSDHSKNNSSINGGNSSYWAIEKNIQFNGNMGLGGITGGVSMVYTSYGTTILYYNSGNTVGFDLPNIDVGYTYYSSDVPVIWRSVLEGNSVNYNISVSFIESSHGGNEINDFNFGSNYRSTSVMFNFGFNDFSFGCTKSQTTYKFIKELPYWYNP